MSASIHFPTQFEKAEDKEVLLKYLGSRIAKNKMGQHWEEVLNRAKSEKDMQVFLEQYPELLPGIQDKHNGPRKGIIVSQFQFGSDYKADFAFVTTNSMELQFTFIEIEDPSEIIFNKDDSFSQHFNHALQQVRDWMRWSKSNTSNLLHMYADLFQNYNISNDLKTSRGFLIYGRRSEIESSQRRKERWSSLAAENSREIQIMTYDRLGAFFVTHPSDEVIRELVTCSYKDRGFVFRPSSIAFPHSLNYMISRELQSDVL